MLGACAAATTLLDLYNFTFTQQQKTEPERTTDKIAESYVIFDMYKLRTHSAIGIIDNENKISYLITQIKRAHGCKILIILINLRAHPSPHYLARRGAVSSISIWLFFNRSHARYAKKKREGKYAPTSARSAQDKRDKKKIFCAAEWREKWNYRAHNNEIYISTRLSAVLL